MIDPTLTENIKTVIRDVADFPKKGILFKDLTTVFKNPGLLHKISSFLIDYYKDKGITKVAGIESRGFILGGILAQGLNAGFIPIRKPGKLPSDIYSIKYELEYGFDAIEMHKDAVEKDDVILLHDDLLATGGTAAAAYDLLQEAGAGSVYLNFIVELSFLNGRDKLDKNLDILSLVSY